MIAVIVGWMVADTVDRWTCIGIYCNYADINCSRRVWVTNAKIFVESFFLRKVIGSGDEDNLPPEVCRCK